MYLLIYPGTIETKAAATKPAPAFLTSLVSRYVIIVVKDENNGAKNTQTFRISIVMFNNQHKWYKTVEVTIKPG